MEIDYRPVTVDDLELLLAWRSHPKIYNRFYNQDGPLEWQGSLKWWESRRNRRDWIIQVKEDRFWRDVGRVNVLNLDSEDPTVGVYVGEITLWGNGVATEAVKFAVEYLKNHQNDYEQISTLILEDNKPSQSVFEKVGFECVGHENEEQLRYKMDI